MNRRNFLLAAAALPIAPAMEPAHLLPGLRTFVQPRDATLTALAALTWHGPELTMGDSKSFVTWTQTAI